MIRHRPLLAISLVVAISFIGIGMVLPVRVLYAQAHGASLAVIGAMASAFLLTNFLCQYPLGALADHWGRRRLMAIGLAAQALLGIAYLAVSDPIWFVVLRCLEGAVSASVLPALYSLNFRLPLFVMAAGFGVCVLVGGTLIRLHERNRVASIAM